MLALGGELHDRARDDLCHWDAARHLGAPGLEVEGPRLDSEHVPCWALPGWSWMGRRSRKVRAAAQTPRHGPCQARDGPCRHGGRRRCARGPETRGPRAGAQGRGREEEEKKEEGVPPRDVGSGYDSLGRSLVRCQTTWQGRHHTWKLSAVWVPPCAKGM